MPDTITTNEMLEVDRMDADIAFCLRDPAIRQQYGGRIVAVWNKQIWGVGQTYSEALATALQQIDATTSDKPTRDALAFTPVPRLPASDLKLPTY